MSLDIQALRDSFALVAERAPELTGRFYEILFERNPELRPMFGKDLRKQEEMLTRALAAVIEHLEDGPWLADTLRALGAKHVDYGVTEEMYPLVGESLLSALGEVAGDAWTPRVKDAWADAFGVIAALMIQGARAAYDGKSSEVPTPNVSSQLSR